LPLENVALTFDQLMRPETFVLSLRKQRFGVGAGLWACRVNGDEQLWMMVTANAARAAAFHDVLGTLAPGLLADIAVFAKKYKQNICIDHRRLAAAAASQPHCRGEP
jgi:predicted amidohydrolase YtcJ